MTVHLDQESVEAVARRVVELMDTPVTPGEMVDAAEIARRFGVSTDYVYNNADRLGAIRLGNGPKARLRFNSTVVAERLSAPTPSAPSSPHPRRQPRRAADIPLLPIRGVRP
jgi:hypothetical protein